MALEKDDVIVSLVGDADLAAGRQMWASSSSQGHGPDQIGTSWWESAYKAPLPQWIQVDLGSQRTVRRLVLKTPDNWPAQNQTLTVEGSEDGSTFTTILASARYDFTPQTIIDLPGALVRCIRLVFTANNGPGPWGERGAFLSGFEVYGLPGEQPGAEGPPLPEPKKYVGPGRTSLSFGTVRSFVGSVWLNFKGELSWDGTGGYTIDGTLEASSSSDARRSTVWLEYGGESESWKKSSETETSNGRTQKLPIRLTGKLTPGEKLELRLGSWQAGVFGIGAVENSEKQQYVIS
ncbi:discoidin domain-containing protein [Kitasatospora sp. GP82]|uniref:discoidin domain-containing protein n=1 Tax=Kitasatospora sp. GP82 TaxID=3035089 RepID=UPI00247558B0|nr:discoidin domain-containing protein [Kitasatospora sp. GP82]